MAETLAEHVVHSIEQLCETMAKDSAKTLLAIGFVTTDDVSKIGAKILFDGDLPISAETYRKLSPVEWIHSDEDAFVGLNRFFESTVSLANENEDNYKQRVRNVFDEFASALEFMDLRKQFGDSLYLTFSGVDPNDVLESEEKRFVKSMNSASVFDQWFEEFD